jgi:predicted PhzF superfamily epimerase YddE/YHI9
MTDIPVTVLRVFCDERGEHGNPLAIIDGAAVSEPLRQGVATELGYSETVYVDDAATGRIRIYGLTRELPFAGHPTVGTSWWLRRGGHDVPVLRVPAGSVAVRFDGDVVRVRGHQDWGTQFALHRLGGPDEVDAESPDAYAEGGPHYVWAWADEPAGRVRARMFGPSVGVPEDEATGAAAVMLTTDLGRDLEITQGSGSRLLTTHEGDGWATVGGRVVADGVRTVVR